MVIRFKDWAKNIFGPGTYWVNGRQIEKSLITGQTVVVGTIEPDLEIIKIPVVALSKPEVTETWIASGEEAKALREALEKWIEASNELRKLTRTSYGSFT